MITGEKWEVIKLAEGNYLVRQEKDGYNIASLYAIDGKAEESNAHAMSAVPELLAVCKGFVELWPVVNGDIKATPEVRRCWNLAKEAIAKAEPTS